MFTKLTCHILFLALKFATDAWLPNPPIIYIYICIYRILYCEKWERLTTDELKVFEDVCLVCEILPFNTDRRPAFYCSYRGKPVRGRCWHGARSLYSDIMYTLPVCIRDSLSLSIPLYRHSTTQYPFQQWNGRR